GRIPQIASCMNAARMTRLIHLFARLYPRPWRERYGAEYQALLDDVHLEDVRPAAWIAADVFTGAIAMQMRTWKSWKIAAVPALLGLAVIAGLFFEMPTTYISNAII